MIDLRAAETPAQTRNRYTRTSSAANIGDDKDSVPRQRKAIQNYANKAG